MSLFNFGKQKEPKIQEEECCCNGNCCENAENSKNCCENISQTARIKVLGSGCSKCLELEENTKVALKNLGIDTTVEKVSDFSVIASYGVMTTPALVIDEKVVSYGKVLSATEIVKILEKVFINE